MPTGAKNAENASVGKPLAVGGAYVAFWDTLTDDDIPTDGTTELSAAWVNAGYVGEDGLTNSTDISDTDPILAWGGDTVILPDGTKSESFQAPLLETKLETLQAIYGKSNVTSDPETGEITVRKNSNAQPLVAWVYEVLLTGDRVKRIVVPRTKLTSLDDVQYTDSDAISYNATFTASGYTGFDGDTSREFIAAIA